MAPGVGIEPTTKGLTVLCSTAELPRKDSVTIIYDPFCLGKRLFKRILKEKAP